MLLLDVPGQIPNSFRAFRVGYDASAALAPRRAVGIHHPNGNVKRISYANNTCALSLVPSARGCCVLASLVILMLLSVRCVQERCLLSSTALPATSLLPCRGDISTSFVAPPFIELGINPTPETHYQVRAFVLTA